MKDYREIKFRIFWANRKKLFFQQKKRALKDFSKTPEPAAERQHRAAKTENSAAPPNHFRWRGEGRKLAESGGGEE